MPSTTLAALLCFWAAAQSVAAQFDCDTSDLSAAGVRNCANAVRTRPGAFQFTCVSSPGPTTHPLRSNGALARAAQRHAEDMAAQGYMSHTSLDGRTFVDRIRQAGYSGSGIAENLARGYSSAFGVIRGWVCSPGHKRNLMSCSYNEVGTGLSCNDGRCYTVQVYGCSGGNCCSQGGLPGLSTPPSAPPSVPSVVPQPIPSAPPTTGPLTTVPQLVPSESPTIGLPSGFPSPVTFPSLSSPASPGRFYYRRRFVRRPRVRRSRG